ncbi:MAG: hypothetical protein HY689_09180 [Chloroflexi bacterium]|nr:hypothetical protein [Chloroflexota bacterium]
MVRQVQGGTSLWSAGVVVALGLLLGGVLLSGCSIPGDGADLASGPTTSAATGAAAPDGDTSGPASGSQPSAATQTSEGGQVTVEVTWKGPNAGPAFTVVMDTHAVDLDGYDLRQLAVLRTDQGAQAQPTDWDAPKGGHHRSGTLTFPATAPDGSALLGPNTRSIELIIRNVAGVAERTFRWTLSPLVPGR